MEKLIYPLWRVSSQSSDQLRDELLAATNVLGSAVGVRGMRLTVADSDVAAASAKRITSSESLPDAVLSVWVNYASGRASVEAILRPLVERLDCYLVTEAEPLAHSRYPQLSGSRLEGMCQVVFLGRPAKLDEEQWLTIWKESHGPIAIDTQSTFGYRQNVIQRSLSAGAPEHHAMIEENFPAEAMTSDYAFYGVQDGDDAALAANMTAMMESCARFIDFKKIDVIPMSEYLLKPLI